MGRPIFLQENENLWFLPRTINHGQIDEGQKVLSFQLVSEGLRHWAAPPICEITVPYGTMGCAWCYSLVWEGMERLVYEMPKSPPSDA
jgi:hypothetical protein